MKIEHCALIIERFEYSIINNQFSLLQEIPTK